MRHSSRPWDPVLVRKLTREKRQFGSYVAHIATPHRNSRSQAAILRQKGWPSTHGASVGPSSEASWRIQSSLATFFSRLQCGPRSPVVVAHVNVRVAQPVVRHLEGRGTVLFFPSFW